MHGTKKSAALLAMLLTYLGADGRQYVVVVAYALPKP